MEYCFGPEWLWWCWMRWYEISNPFSQNKNVSSYSEVSKMFLKYLFLRLPLLIITLASYLQFNASHTVCLSDLRKCRLCQGIGRAGISPSLFSSFCKDDLLKVCNLVTSWKEENVWDLQVNMPEATTYSFSWGVTILSYMVFSFIVWMPYILSYSVFLNNGCSFITAISFFTITSHEQQPQKFHFSCT